MEITGRKTEYDRSFDLAHRLLSSYLLCPSFATNDRIARQCSDGNLYHSSNNHVIVSVRFLWWELRFESEVMMATNDASPMPPPPEGGPPGLKKMEISLEQRDAIRRIFRGSGMDSQQQFRFADQLAAVLGIDPGALRPY